MSLTALYDVPAPAKLNLFLHVVGRRTDGYHLLQSVFVLIDWADVLHFERRLDGRLQRHDLGAALPADDLCLQAARALKADTGTPLGADISIRKHVPWGAGLGGGSSDAASTLLALNRLWELGLPRARLAAIGLKLGADVPFFLGGRDAFVEGIGERLTPIELPGAAYAVLKPPAAIATREVFGHPSVRHDTDAVIVAGLPQEAGHSGLHAVTLQEIAEGYGRNDLQPAAEQHCGEVAQAATWLGTRYGNSRMTGSGSAVFARVCGTAGQHMAAFPAEQVPQGWVGRMCRSLSTHPLGAWAA